MEIKKLINIVVRGLFLITLIICQQKRYIKLIAIAFNTTEAPPLFGCDLLSIS